MACYLTKNSLVKKKYKNKTQWIHKQKHQQFYHKPHIYSINNIIFSYVETFIHINICENRYKSVLCAHKQQKKFTTVYKTRYGGRK